MNCIEYEMIPGDSFSVIRGCAKCGRKIHFRNTGKYRVNANGNQLDVWLIYQCEECKHTLNLAIYERQKVSSIPKEEYQRFLDNAFTKLRETEENGESSSLGNGIMITIYNPCKLKICPEKQIAMLLGLSRSQVKSMLETGELEWKKRQPWGIFFGANAEESGKY